MWYVLNSPLKAVQSIMHCAFVDLTSSIIEVFSMKWLLQSNIVYSSGKLSQCTTATIKKAMSGSLEENFRTLNTLLTCIGYVIMDHLWYELRARCWKLEAVSTRVDRFELMFSGILNHAKMFILKFNAFMKEFQI